ncbi:TetR/AcrR family transcriptional regulator [Ralstonia pseudosolanacearum]|uniref:TetR/AcrR family transcriptional regulator n=1 Tax=Ralstonia pseudosolanacearum TaxID=1310165 RepID=UPI00267627A7|nr:TetR/AcrR family transcriptional regulator [Ralstonia pseudosolanacearum]MDO3526372.1 TetR/AcrR family transcriptional regulator [Ralstonia pseudosolanacearum]
MRTKTEARREAILAAARAVFEEVGFAQATMEEVTARVGGSKATLYRYFNSKEALFAELLERSANEHSTAVFSLLHSCAESPEAEVSATLALLNPDEDVSIILQQFGERVLKTFYTPQKLYAKRMVIAAANDPKVGKLFYENGPLKGMRFIQQYFEGVMKAGHLRQADTWIMTCQFRALLTAEVEEPGMLNAKAELTDEEIHATVTRAVRAFMRLYEPG